MILPNYEEIITKDTKSEVRIILKFDKISVRISGDAKYSRTEIIYSINSGCRRRNIDLSMYINAVNDYFVSHPVYKKYGNRVVNLFDFGCVKSLEFWGLRLCSNEFQIIKNKYPNILSVDTKKCTIYKEASIGCLECNYYDDSSNIMSLDSFDGFSGKSIILTQSHIISMNKRTLHLNNIYTKLRGTNINYEHFFLTTSAPNMRKIEIFVKHYLEDKDLMFISGFYNLESIHIPAILSSYEPLKKLERLREIRYIFCSDEKELEKTRKQREEIYQKILASNGTENQLKNYLMTQNMIIQNNYYELMHKLYVPRLERVKWEDKISTKDLERIKDELIEISNMSLVDRKNISREKKREYTLSESSYGLDFDNTPGDEDVVLKDSNPFGEGIHYYAKSKKIIRY